MLASNLVDWNKCLKIDSKHPKIKALVNQGDIVIVTRGGKCGRIFLHTEKAPFVTGQVCTIIKSIEPNLYERILAKQEEITNLIAGVAINNISLKSISELDV